MKLSIFPFFKNCNEEILNILSQDAKYIYFEKGKVIHFEDELCNALEIIVSGKVSIIHNSEQGILHTVKILGNNSFISPNNLYASNNTYFVYIEALTNTSIIRIPKGAIDKALENLSFRNQFLKMLSDNGKLMSYKLIEDQKLNLREKILIYLKHQFLKQNNNIIILPVSKTILASIFGVARTSLSRELQKMEQDGLIIFNHKQIRLTSNI